MHVRAYVRSCARLSVHACARSCVHVIAGKNHINNIKHIRIAETTCKAPTNIVGGVRSVGSLTVGSKVTYQPADRYRHVSGDLVRTCGENEHCDGEQPVFEGT